MAPGAGCFAFIVLAPESALLETMAILVEAMTNRIHSFDRVSLFERQGFWGLGQWRRNLHKVSPPHPLFQRAPFPGAGRRNRQQRGWNGRIGARRPAGFPLVRGTSRRGLILPSL